MYIATNPASIIPVSVLKYQLNGKNHMTHIGFFYKIVSLSWPAFCQVFGKQREREVLLRQM